MYIVVLILLWYIVFMVRVVESSFGGKDLFDLLMIYVSNVKNF